MDMICKLFDAASGDAVVLVDACTVRHGVQEEVRDLLNRTGFPVYAAPMGKTAVDESHTRYGGVGPSDF